jgi:hypothetical protein
MRISQIANSIQNTDIPAKLPVMIWGKPGIGKSDMIAQVAENLNLDFVDIRLNTLEPVDVRGYPFRDPEQNTMHFAPSAEFPRDPDWKGIICLDEINSAPRATQAAAYQLVLNRRVGEYVLPKDAHIIAAGNYVEDKAVVEDMPTPLRNRFVHYFAEPNLDDWVLWANKNDVDFRLISFLRFRPDLLFQFDSDAFAFATPRSWSMLDRKLKHLDEPEKELESFTGVVGEGPGAEFVGFLRIQKDMPDLDIAILNPKTTKVPEQGAALYATAAGLATKANSQNIDNIFIYAERLPGEFQVLTIKDIMQRDPSMMETAAMLNWAAKNSNLIL